MKLLSKGNGKNYYGVEKDGSIQEIVRKGGYFYKTKYVLGEGLRPIGNPLRKGEFTLKN